MICEHIFLSNIREILLCYYVFYVIVGLESVFHVFYKETGFHVS